MNNVMREAIKRGLLGIFIGIAIGQLISLAFSLFAIRDGNYYPTPPDLVIDMGGTLNAALIQVAMSGLIGMIFAGGSVVWDMEDLSLLKQTIYYFAIGILAIFPAGYVLRWMERSLTGLILFSLTYIMIFFIIWIANYAVYLIKVRGLNSKFNNLKK